MKRIIVLFLAFALVSTTMFSVAAVTGELTETGDKVVITDGTWAHEKIGGYGFELDEYIGSDAVVSLPWTFAKEYITAVGSYAFNGNTRVTSVTTTGVLQSIDDYAFNGCTSLEQIVLYDALTSLGVGAFYGDASLTDINLEATSVSAVSAYCFAECGFSRIALPETCTSIGNMVFYNCKSLSRIIIPESVTDIAESAFLGCDALTIYCYTDSTAHQFAEAHQIPYVLIDVPILLGDADGDGYVDVTDATIIQRVLSNIPVSFIDEEAADVDSDGEVSAIDVTLIMRYAALIDVQYPIGEWVTPYA